MDKFHEIELEKIIDASQSLYTIRGTVGSVAASVVLAVLGTALTAEKAGLFFIAAGVTLIFIYLDSSIKSAMATHYFRSLELRNQYSPNDNDALLSMFSLTPDAKQYIAELLDKPEEIRYKKLENYGLKFRSFPGFWLPLLSAIADISIGFWLMFAYQPNWMFF